jgi:hypothetical protein
MVSGISCPISFENVKKHDFQLPNFDTNNMNSPAYFECKMPKTFLILSPVYAAQTVIGNEYIPRNQNELFLTKCGNPHAIQEVKMK